MKSKKNKKVGVAILASLGPAVAVGVTTGVVYAAIAAKTPNQQTFSFGNNVAYNPLKKPMDKIAGADKKQVAAAWLKAIKEDPTIFYDDVHYAIDRELYIPQEQSNLFTIKPQGTLNFKYFNVDEKEASNPKLSFEVEYYYLVEVNKDAQILGPDWWKVEFNGRIDVYDFPILAAAESDMTINAFDSYNGDTTPYFAINLDATGVKEKTWYIHGIELGYVWDKDGNKYEHAKNGWLSGYDTKFDRGELGYFIGVVPFLYDCSWIEGSASKCLNISNYYMMNNLIDKK